jgi:hypothetical protein
MTQKEEYYKYGESLGIKINDLQRLKMLADNCQEDMIKSIEDSWVKYREITNNEDAWLFKQWLVSYLNK